MHSNSDFYKTSGQQQVFQKLKLSTNYPYLRYRKTKSRALIIKWSIGG